MNKHIKRALGIPKIFLHNNLWFVIVKIEIILQFGLIIFNEKAETPNGCYGDQLVPITHRTRQSLRQFMNSRIAAGGAHFAKGLHRAFAYFKSATDGKHRGQHTNLIHVNLYNTLGSFPQQNKHFPHYLRRILKRREFLWLKKL